MKQLKGRALLILLLALTLLVGVALYCIFYVVNGGAWAAFSANDHTHTDGELSVGQICDRNGVTLYDAVTSSYAENALTRISTLHAVGDPVGNISTGAKTVFSDRLVGFNPITGTSTGGHTVTLTLDSALNEAAYEALNGHKGTVALYNYETGEILCMVSAPSFDPEDPPSSTDSSEYEGVYLNRFLSSTFVPGSIFKVVTTAAAIDLIPDIFDRTYTCTGSVKIAGDTITCTAAHGEEDFSGAFANSCNCYYALLAEELGGDTLAKYAKEAGLTTSQSVSGIDTAAGSFDVAEDGSSALGWSGVGQYNDMVNPCAMMTLMGAIARDGVPVAPRLLKHESGLLVSQESSTTLDRVWSAGTCSALQTMMANNVTQTYGAEKFGNLPVCAKSGTAEVDNGSPHAWFVGFLNDETHPYAFAVLVENGGGGASVAGTIAAQILQKAVELAD
jgi:cell division protein FtsI/penicillin-binding protein 2